MVCCVSVRRWYQIQIQIRTTPRRPRLIPSHYQHQHLPHNAFVASMAASTGRHQPGQQPPWRAPAAHSAATVPEVAIYNSLTKSKTKFIPIDPTGKKIAWYACGPTVYDDSHLGHARNYVTTDIIRRILRDFFRFDIHFVMNITDVDDKIILRGRQQHLLGEFRKQNKSFQEVLDTTNSAYRAYLKKNTPKIPPDTPPTEYPKASEAAYGHVLQGASLAGDGSPPGDNEAKLKMHLKTLATASVALSSPPVEQAQLDGFYDKVEDVLLPYLDSLHGTSIDANDHSIFTKLTKKFEQRFMDDMRALNCLDPDVVTRVTEYGPQIVAYVERIIKNGFGYMTSDGSVYFDIQAFEAAGKPYARLEPHNRNDKSLQADGEGALAAKTTEKKSDADFALWKSSKPGEPSWPSPWGKGRPGWHIECSAMASDVLGKTLDIHSGGIDLAFPHHDNELAQSEAYWHEHDHQWVNYFMHMGHLSIQGSKMSKSLKNFTTIREALSRGVWTPRSIRIVFLQGSWDAPIEITDSFAKAGAAWEDKINNFFLKARQVERLAAVGNSALNGTSKSGETDKALLNSLSKAQKDVKAALGDSFNTQAAMIAISDLITEYNSKPRADISRETTTVLAQWVTEMVQTFGLDGDPVPGRIGWSGIDIPAAAEPFVYPVSALRDEIRQRAKAGELNKDELVSLSGKKIEVAQQTQDSQPYAEILSQFQESISGLANSQAPAKDFLKLCDELRDIKLWDKGIYLEDSLEPGQPAMPRPLDRDMIRAREEREEREKERQEAKAKRDQEAAKRAERGRLSPLDMFKTSEYSAWDADGLPTKDASGEDVAKSKLKKLKKLWDSQKRAHDEWKKTAAETP